MKGIEIVHEREATTLAAHPIAGHSASDGATHKLMSPPDGSLWLVRTQLPEGATITLPESHGDEALYVWSGELRVDDAVIPEKGTAVVESRAHPQITATMPTTVVHMGPHDPEVPSDGLNGPCAHLGDAVHAIGPRGVLEAIAPDRDSHYYADSTCPTCRLTLLYTSRFVPYVSATHSHSVDELIHVVWGTLHLGNHVVGPGDTLAIAADRRYGFRSGPDGFGFLNYRRDASEQTVAPGSAPIMEGGLINGFTPVSPSL